MDARAIELTGTHIKLILDPLLSRITAAHGRFESGTDFGDNLLSRAGLGWRLFRDSARHGDESHAEAFRVLELDLAKDRLDCTVAWRTGDGGAEALTIRWRVSIEGRSARVRASVQVQEPLDVDGIALDVSCGQWLLTGLFERGVLQQVGRGNDVFASDDPLAVFYTVGHGQGSLALVPRRPTSQTALVRAEAEGAVGVQLIPFGSYSTVDTWTEPTWLPIEGALQPGQEYEVDFNLYANDLPFPTHALSDDTFASAEDARTHYTALYATEVGCVGSYEIPGSCYPTLALPERSYGDRHTFFDPDAWSVVAALSFSGDPYLEREARKILDRAFVGITDAGQVPHHFDRETPTFVAISGAPQTGPNLFWCLAALDYVCATGDDDWLRSVWTEGIVSAMAWVVQHLDAKRGLLCVAGPLWVDVFRRSGFTLDTNAMAVHVLDRVGQAARYLGEFAIAESLYTTARMITVGLEALWDGKDHYVTSRGRNWDQIEDKVDAENYLMVAFGLVDPDRGELMLERMDSGPFAHPGAKGTWVSERYYGAEDCYLQNEGDSSCAMARLWWGDLRARQATGDGVTFRKLYEAVRADLHTHTWMSERYDSQGQMVRAEGYHEYPGILDMALREVYYGVILGMAVVEVRPMRSGPFSFRLGRTSLVHSPQRVELQIPGHGARLFRIGGLLSGREYAGPGRSVSVADHQGLVEVTGEAGTELVLELRSSPVGDAA